MTHPDVMLACQKLSQWSCDQQHDANKSVDLACTTAIDDDDDDDDDEKGDATAKVINNMTQTRA